MQFLGWEHATEVLPQTGPCPQCNSRSLSIYKDNTNLGYWHNCSCCQQHGDLIELTSKVTGSPLRETVDKLIENDLFIENYRDQINSDVISSYEKLIVNKRIKAERLWEKASKYLPQSGNNLRNMRINMELATHDDSQNWRIRGGEYVGAVSKEEITELFFDENKSKNFLFRKHDGKFAKWDEALLMPLYDLPNRLTGFYFASPDHDLEYRSIYNIDELYPGITMPDVTGLGPVTSIGDTLFLLLDPELALRLHIRHFMNYDYKLPIVATLPQLPVSAIISNNSSVRKIVVWCRNLDANAFRHAAALNANLILNTAVLEPVEKQIRRASSLQWLKEVYSQSRAWQDLLEEVLTDLPIFEINDFIDSINIDRYQLRFFLENCRPKLRERLDKAYKSKNSYKSVIINNHSIYEANNVWFLEKSNEVLSDAIVRIENIVFDNENNKQTYQGYITYKDNQIPFSIPKNNFDNKLYDYLQTSIISNCQQLPDINVNHKNLLPQVSLKFSNPKIINISAKIGWNNNKCELILPRFIICNGGLITENPSYPFIRSYKIPGIKLKPPELLTTEDSFLLLKNNDETKLIINIIVAVIHNILADVYNYRKVGFIISDLVVNSVTKILEFIGCIKSKKFSFRKLEKHGWPVNRGYVSKKNQESNKYLELKNHNCFIALEDISRDICIVNGGWFAIKNKYPDFINNKYLNITKKLLPILLKFIAGKKFYRKSGLDGIEAIYDDIRKWFESEYGGSKYKINNEFIGTTEEDRIEAFINVLRNLFNNGLIGWQREGFTTKDKRPNLIHFPDQKAIFIPKTSINQVLKNKSPNINLGTVSRLLHKNEILIDEIVHNNIPGWLIIEKVWHSFKSEFE